MLDPALTRLSGDSQRLWLDADERRRAIEAIVDAWESRRTRLGATIARLDQAIVDGLLALELPRGPTREVRVEATGRGWIARKDPVCDLIFDGVALKTIVRDIGRPDDAFRTWIHESLHARKPFATESDVEQRRFRGFEEGLVEALARLATRDKAGMTITAVSYQYYVESYRALADVLSTDLEGLLRRLWQFPAGRVREVFVGIVDDERQAHRVSVMSMLQRTRLQAVADILFSSD